MNYKKIREFYNKLMDEESRFIFEKRISYLVTGDRKNLYDMTQDANRLFHPAKIIRNVQYLLKHKEDFPADIVIYGAGEASKDCLELIQAAGINVLAFCDKAYQKWRTNGHFGLSVISPKELLSESKYSACVVVVSSLLYYKDICDSLLCGGRKFHNERIFIMEGQYNFSNYVYQGSYFQQEFIKPVDNEVFIDVGCYDGYTIKKFSEFCSGNYKLIFGFEPHPINYKRTIENLTKWGLPNLKVFQKGAWSIDGEYSFALEFGTGAEGARILETGQAHVETTTIDKVAGDEQITLIKMDVEGAELEALKGASNTISRWKPRLAICLYHKPEDIVEIPEFLYDLRPDYNYYIRHHNYIQNVSDIALDTVLYAV